MTIKEAKEYFFGLKNQRNVFSTAFEMKMMNDEKTCVILDQKCKNGHKFSDRIKSIGCRLFNIFSKNFIAELNDKIHEERKRSKSVTKDSSSARKITKLQSD